MEYTFSLVNICYCDWFNKESDWPITEQEEIGCESQTRKMQGGRTW